MKRNVKVYVNKRPRKKRLNKKIIQELAIENEVINVAETLEREEEKENIEEEVVIQNEAIKLIEEWEREVKINNIHDELNSENINEDIEINTSVVKREEHKDEIYNTSEVEIKALSCLSTTYSGQIYKSRRIVLNPPKQDVIVCITNITRDIYVNDIEILESGISVNVAMTIGINYGTSKDIFVKKEEHKENKDNKDKVLITSEKNKNPIILSDGVVRNATIIVPFNIYVKIPEDKSFSKCRLISQDFKVSDTQYILDNGEVVNIGIPIGSSLKGIMEKYIISVVVEVI